MDIVITSNSPGELYSFVRPVIAALSKRLPEARIILVITPCQFASGREIEVSRSFKELYEIILPEEYSKWAFKNTPPKGITFSDKGIVLYTGGDMMNAVILSKKLGYKAVAYTMNMVSWKHHYTKFFVPDEDMADKAFDKGVEDEHITVVGDLMTDAVSSTAKPEAFGLDPKKAVITLLPGSRQNHIRFLAPYFLNVADKIAENLPDAQFVFGLSPYTNFVKIEESVDEKNADQVTKKLGAFGRLIIESGKKYLLTNKGTKVHIIEKSPYDSMNIADLIITIPGTNTAEAAALGIPMIVAMPTQKSEDYLFEGLLGIIGNVPVLGKLVKKLAVNILNRKIDMMALPNRKAGRKIAPEIRGNVTAAEISEMAVSLLATPQLLKEMSHELKAAMGPKGAAKRIADEIAVILEAKPQA